MASQKVANRFIDPHDIFRKATEATAWKRLTLTADQTYL
jgi:hypothetical protein